MPLAERIAPHLPNLRRFARLLTGSQRAGDTAVARLLEASESRINDLLEQASKEIGRQIATEVLIIEDEPLIAMDLERMLLDLGHRVTSIARTHKDALKAAALQKPGLVLADIRLADGSSGLDAVNDILGAFTVPVVFITAYPEKLMT